MKNGTHGRKPTEKLSAYRILQELYEHRKEHEDGLVHVHKIKDGRIEKEFDRY